MNSTKKFLITVTVIFSLAAIVFCSWTSGTLGAEEIFPHKSAIQGEDTIPGPKQREPSDVPFMIQAPIQTTFFSGTEDWSAFDGK